MQNIIHFQKTVIKGYNYFIMQSNTSKSNKEGLQVILQAISYKKTFEPLISDRKKSAIQQKLKLEKQASQHTRERQNQLDYYVKYNYNPFIQIKMPDYQPIIRDRDQPIVNIVDKMTELKIKIPDLKPSIEQKSFNINSVKAGQESVSQKMINNIQKGYTMTEPDYPFKIKKKQEIKQQRAIPRQNQTEQILKDQDIDIITNIKQQNFFVHNKKVNIFKIAKGDDDQISNKQILKKYYFCNNSMVEKIAKLKLPMYRQLSSMARENITGQKTKENIIDYVDSYELSYKVHDLLFHDLLSFASNRLSADYLNNQINFEQAVNNKQMSDASSLQEDDDKSFIFFRKNQDHVQNNFVNPNQQAQQIQDYKLLSTNPTEQKHEKRYHKERDYVHQQIQLKKDLRKNTVKDNIIHKQIGKSVQESIKRLVSLDQKKMDVDRLVRMNKNTKNRNQVLKIKTLIETLAHKNKQSQIQQPSKSNNKKKTK